MITAPQIQYSQQVFINFNGLTCPQISVAPLVRVQTVELDATWPTAAAPWPGRRRAYPPHG